MTSGPLAEQLQTSVRAWLTDTGGASEQALVARAAADLEAFGMPARRVAADCAEPHVAQARAASAPHLDHDAGVIPLPRDRGALVFAPGSGVNHAGVDAALETWMRVVRVTIEAAIARDGIDLAALGRPAARGRIVPSPDGVEWVYVAVNDEYRDLIGRPDIIGRLGSEIIPGGRRGAADLFAAIAQMMATGEPIRLERQVKERHTWLQTRLCREGPDQFVAVIDLVNRQKAAEAQLAASERRFERMFDDAPIGIGLSDARGAFLRVNRRLCQMLGYTEPELRALSYQDVTVAAFADHDAELHDQMITGQRAESSIVKQLRRKDGSHGWYRVTVSRWTDDDDDEPRFIAITEDITAQKQAEDATAASEARLRLFVEHAPAAIALFDRDLRYLAASRRFARDYRLGDVDVVGRLHHEVFPDLPARWREIHARCLAGATAASDGEPFPRADGRVDWVRWEMRPWYQPDGAIGGLVLFSELFTEQQQIAQALRTTEARFRAVFEQAGIGIALMEPGTGRYLEVNDALCRLLGYQRDELRRRTWHDLAVPADLAGEPAAAPATRSWTLDRRQVRKDGQEIWCRLTITRIDDPGGAPMHLALIEDVTEARRATDALRESERRLAVVFERSLAGLGVFRRDDRHLIEVSDSLVRMLGWSREELLGRTLGELGLFVDPGDVARVRAAAEHGEGSIELAVRRRSGELGTFLLTTGAIEVDGAPCYVGMLHDVTEQRRADAALRASEAHLRTLVDLAPVGIVETEPSSDRIVRVNAAMAALTGYTRDELRGMSVADDLTHPDDRDPTRVAMRALRDGAHEPVVIEKRYLRKDGQVVWANTRVQPLHDAAGQRTGVLALLEDVTARRAAHAELQLRTSAMQAAANAIVITDTQGRIESFNRAFVTLTGYTESELRGARTSLLRSGVQPPEFYRVLWDTIRAGGVWRGELVNRRKDGSFYDEDMTITPVRDDAGAIARYIAIKQDITERRRTEQALRDSEARYRALVDSLDDVVLTTDGTGRVTFVNRAIARYGYTPDELRGAAFVTMLHDGDRDAWRDGLAAGATPPHELRVFDAHHKLRTVRVVIRPRTTGDATGGVTAVLTDLTERRETEEQLRAAQKMEAVGRLAGGVAHDFNNLLSVILSYTDLAVADLHEGDPLRADLQEVLAAGHRAEGLTRQLLAFSRKQLLTPEPTDLHELVGGLAKMLRRLIGEDVELVMVPDGAATLTVVDRGQMEQVIMNLVVNARDAMVDGGSVTIATADVDLDAAAARALDVPPGRYVQLTVADTGCGMSEDVRARVFEPFFTTKGVGKGTGLGLSMVYGIVRQSGGAIVVDSAPGAGATFRIYLPADASAAPEATPRAATRRANAGHETVLVVEDEAALRSVVQRVLSNAGYDVLVAAHAGEALILAQRHGARVRLILTDVIMPAMSGRELAERLTPLCPQATVIFMSGYTDEALERFGLRDTEFLRKPFDLRVLTERVRAALDTRAPP